MRFVDRPHCRPMRCAVMPNIGQTAPTRWIDTGSELDGFDNHVYVSETAAREMARMFGMVPGVEVRDRDEQIVKLKADLNQAIDYAESLEAQLAAIQVLESAGMAVRKAPAKKEKVVA